MIALYRPAFVLFFGTLGCAGGMLYGYGWLTNG